MKKKILSVDDSKAVRALVKKAFSNFEIDIIEAPNGVEGLSAASKEIPNLILLDVTMPVMDGVEMLTRLKGDPALKGIPVIMLTAEGGREKVMSIAKLGIRDYIVKPFKEGVLIDKVSRIIDLSKDSRRKTILDPARVLLVEDKPAIVEAVRQGLAGTPWEIMAAGSAYDAIDRFVDREYDLVIISLSFDGDISFEVFKKMKAHNSKVPIVGLVVKTDTDRQHKALQAGFDSIITKPIDQAELETRACRSMGIDTSPRYYLFENGRMRVVAPDVCTQARVIEMRSFMERKVTEAVDSGHTSVLIDGSQVTEMDVNLIKFLIELMNACERIDMNCQILASERLRKECDGFEESKSWKFVDETILAAAE
ncbi:response regulator [Ruficoccus amylovorans]|uniref:Response regulator n=1 Tax=Ruficoccus amylovorans TaxID=1804625 RepID=A0A842HIF7_9BACT|nr:response regulator [Ruficoccus amylovorans]MBC2595001.1 response regulator [Ruficoccus amylovorans]